MAINFKLAAVRDLRPEDEDMNRAWVGYDPAHAPQRTYEQNRGLWHLGPRADAERWATFSMDGHIKVVVEIADIETVESKRGLRARRAIIGRVLGPGDGAYDYFIGRQVDGHRSPVTYIADPV